MEIGAQIRDLLASAGDLWFVAFLLQGFAIICESAKPGRVAAEGRSGPRGLALLAAVLSLFTPIVLFVHAFATAGGALIIVVAAIAGAIVAATLIGWMLRLVAGDGVSLLARAAPVLSLAAFALALYAGWRSTFDILNFLVASFARG
ncbi:MAG: hypothetical protein KF700_03225 [Hyphomonadaceae bacterium]|nr:hypothetical protein [Hyphomonadaceae bacterium]